MFFVYIVLIVSGLCIAAGTIAFSFIFGKNVAAKVASYVSKLSQTIANAAGELIEKFVLACPRAGAAAIVGVCVLFLISSLVR